MFCCFVRRMRVDYELMYVKVSWTHILIVVLEVEGNDDPDDQDL